MPPRTATTTAPPGYYDEAPAPAGVASHVACLWVRRVGPASATPVVPDGCTDLMWITDDGRSRLVVAGPDTRAHHDGLGSAAAIAAVRFLPGAARTVLGIPLDAIRDERPELADLWGPDAAERLAEAADASERPDQVLATAVADRLRDAGPGDPAMRAVAASLRASRDPSPVRGLADAVGLSERQLHRRSLAAFGYGPKTLHRVLRFQGALARARAGDDLARVAHECGYADQAHLARDVSALSDTTLTRLLAS